VELAGSIASAAVKTLEIDSRANSVSASPAENVWPSTVATQIPNSCESTAARAGM
jgi:hypothetical protein